MMDSPRRSLWLLAIWCERQAAPGRPAVWRFSLEDARTGGRRGFGSLEEMTAFLQAQMEAGAEQSTGD